MRIHNRKWNIWSRRITSLLLLCGLLLPMMPQTSAASVTYKYNWIKSTTGLPTDNQWHDYFIAWEDTDDSNKYWFTDYHWYTADGYNNYDVGGTHWMEYKAASTLPDHTSDSFSSKECLGHLQIKFVGWTGAENNAPKYLIRMATMDGRYKYLTKYEPTDKEEDADAFTFLEKGDEFHIFVSIPGKADRYLTRDGQYLETTESTSYGGGEYWRPLRVYQRTFTVDEEQDIGGDKIGKVTLYEYSWVNTVEELMELANGKDWTNVLLAWENAHGDGTSAPDTVWFTKEYWEDAKGNPNYNNDGANEWWYYSNDYLGSDGYGSAYAESFILPSRVGHFQVKRVDWDDDNPIHGYKNAEGKEQDSPVFNIRFDIGREKYIYIGNGGTTGTAIAIDKATGERAAYVSSKADGTGGPAGGCNVGVSISKSGLALFRAGYGTFSFETSLVGGTSFVHDTFGGFVPYSAQYRDGTLTTRNGNIACFTLDGQDYFTLFGATNAGMSVIWAPITKGADLAYYFTGNSNQTWTTHEIAGAQKQDQGGLVIGARNEIIVALKHNTNVPGGVYAIDPATNAMAWKYEVGAEVGGTPAVDKAGNVHILDDYGMYYIVKPDYAKKTATLVAKTSLFELYKETGHVFNEGDRCKAFTTPIIGPDGRMYNAVYFRDSAKAAILSAVMCLEYEGCKGYGDTPWPLKNADCFNSGHQLK